MVLTMGSWYRCMQWFNSMPCSSSSSTTTTTSKNPKSKKFKWRRTSRLAWRKDGRDGRNSASRSDVTRDTWRVRRASSGETRLKIHSRRRPLYRQIAPFQYSRIMHMKTAKVIRKHTQLPTIKDWMMGRIQHFAPLPYNLKICWETLISIVNHPSSRTSTQANKNGWYLQ